MIDDVQAGNADFDAILVYDVSRWGRFQDTDESAYYEYLCKRAGIDVHYCAEQFENDGGPAATIIKSVKRVMAAEYSRELSSKVFKGQCKLIELGYRQGGPAGYGLRRMLIDHTHKEKGILARGEKKSLQTDRVILVRGPEEEVRVVQWIYQLFIRENRSEREIAEILNAQGILTDLGRPWTRGTVREVLTNEKYIGNNVYNRRSFKLKKKRVVNTPDMWVRREAAFDPIISPEDFYTAQGIILARARRLTDDEMLERLRGLLAKHSLLVQRSDRLGRGHARKLGLPHAVRQPSAGLPTRWLPAGPGLRLPGRSTARSDGSIPSSLTTWCGNLAGSVPRSAVMPRRTCW